MNVIVERMRLTDGRKCVVAVKSYVGGSRSCGREIMRKDGAGRRHSQELYFGERAKTRTKMTGSGEEERVETKGNEQVKVGR